jgi:hypothetical protein
MASGMKSPHEPVDFMPDNPLIKENLGYATALPFLDRPNIIDSPRSFDEADHVEEGGLFQS